MMENLKESMESLRLVIEEDTFFFSKKTKEYATIVLFLKENKINDRIIDHNIGRFQQYIQTCIIQLTDSEKLKSERKVLSRNKKIDYDGVEYDLNLSEELHSHLYSLILLDKSIKDSTKEKILIEWNPI